MKPCLFCKKIPCKCKKATKISEDELTHRMSLKHKFRDSVGQQATDLIEFSIDRVLIYLGVKEEPRLTIAEQMELFGIILQEITNIPSANGFYIFFPIKKKGLVPIAWIGGAGIDNEGYMFCWIEWYHRRTRLGWYETVFRERIRGAKVPQAP